MPNRIKENSLVKVGGQPNMVYTSTTLVFNRKIPPKQWITKVKITSRIKVWSCERQLLYPIP